MTIKPISPSEVAQEKAKNLPDYVIVIWNKLIAKHWNGYRSFVIQGDVINAVIAQEPCLSRHDIIGNGYLEVEDIYRAQGWDVTYDRPAYNEPYEPTFTFKKK